MVSCRECLALITLAWAAVAVGAGTGHEINLTDGTDVMACVRPDEAPQGAADTRPNAYMVMIGPFNEKRQYKKWLYAVLALSTALKTHGSTADVVVLCAQKAHDPTHALPEEEALLSANGIHWRYVGAPYGNGGFHMGHYKLWAWQHTEYARIQLLDADLLPLVNMDRFFALGQSLDSDFVGCPGKLSVLNAGWFVLKPSCEHFEAMTQLIKADGAAWDKERGWGHPLPYWLSSEGQRMKPGWDFFDAHGNQGHMYSYFLFDAQDLTFIYADEIHHYGSGDLDKPSFVLSGTAQAQNQATADALKAEVYGAYPCPFPMRIKERAYIHFTGNVKPWTKYNPQNPQFQLWYEAVQASGDVSVARDIFGSGGGV
mmetsp:Transcript_64525/g.126726  ORF Transcript_64525/g.126726 Transcript_64525/m.126726 type:complete len:371 (-) Transcript_64525:223-1335(-)